MHDIDEYFYVQHIVRPGETVSSSGHETRIGGKGANQAVAIARAGGNVRFYGTIGQDGLWIKDRMRDYGIEVNGIVIADEPTGRAVIQVDKEGENSIILFPGANFSEFHEKAFKEQGDGLFPQTTHLLLQNEIPLSATYYALQNARTRNATVIMNPSPLPMPSDICEFPWNKVDWLIVNEAEAQGLYQATAGSQEDLSLMSAGELIFLLSKLPSFATTNIVCTLGANGVLAFLPTFHRPKTTVDSEVPMFLHLPAATLTGDIQDTTGAGDCFTGYFVQGLMELASDVKVGREIEESNIARILKTCVHAAGMCVEKRGTIDSIPTRSQVEDRMLANS